jgi:hypothetical protein
MNTELEARFDNAMMDVYRRCAGRVRLQGNAFFAHATRASRTCDARILLHASNVSEGYLALRERKRIDLTVGSVIIGEERRSPFSEQRVQMRVTGWPTMATLRRNEA